MAHMSRGAAAALDYRKPQRDPSAVKAHQKASSSGGDFRHENLNRRRYELAYISVLMLTFPLYWAKIMDWRLCEAPPEALAVDPWLMLPPPAEWITSWPCEGTVLSKMRYTLSSPGPFLRSLVWPISRSEVQYLTSFLSVIVGGFAMWVLVPLDKYTVDNPVRISWSLCCRIQVKGVVILSKVLSPATPWSMAVSRTLHTQALSSLIFSTALVLPVRIQALGALVELSQVALICWLHGTDWPYELSPRTLLVLQAMSVVVAVAVASIMLYGLPGAGLARGARLVVHALTGRRTTGERGTKSPKLAADQQAGDHLVVGGNASVSKCSSGERRRVSADGAAGIPEEIPAAKQPATPVDLSSACLGLGADVSRRIELCRRLTRADRSASSTSAPATGASSVTDSGKQEKISMDGTDSHSGAATAAVPTAGAREEDLAAAYASALVQTHLYLKLPQVEPEHLEPGAQQRVAAALAGWAQGVVGTDVALRAGCVEVHLDIVGGAGSAVAAVDPTAAPGTQLAPASAQQQGLASCILQALGLPPCYDATVRAQIGAHLLTLTPAAPAGASGGAWAVLSTRPMQALEVPWVSRVEPPAVVTEPCGGRGEGAGAGGLPCACGCRAAPSEDAPSTPLEDGTGPGDAGGKSFPTPLRHVASVRLTVSGSAERLLGAHADPELEILALFEGEFLPVTQLRWGPLESPCAAMAVGAGGVRLPSSLAVSQRVVDVRLSLPRGRSGALSLVLVRRGTAGRSHALLLLRPQDAAIAAEVAELQARAHRAIARVPGSVGPPVNDLDRFVADLGRWLQYRDFWCAHADRTAAGDRGGTGKAAAVTGSGRSRRVGAGAWKDALMARFWPHFNYGCDVDGKGLQPKQGVDQQEAVLQQASVDNGPALAGMASGRGTALLPVPSGKLALGPIPGVSGVQEQEDDTCSRRRSLVVNGQGTSRQHGWNGDVDNRRGPSHPHVFAVQQNEHRCPPQQACQHAQGHQHPHERPQQRQKYRQREDMEAHERLAQGSVPALGQPAYQNHMRSARRVLLEFALEHRCAAVATALLGPTPLPTAPAAPAPPGFLPGPTEGSASSSARLLEPELVGGDDFTHVLELSELSRTASSDGLSLLHRAVRSGDRCIVEVVLQAAAKAAAALACALTQVHGDRDTGHDGAQASPGSHRGGSPADPEGLRLLSWDAPDVHGLTPLHYVAVLDDGGALARHVLGAHPEALALWDVGGPGMPSPASFAAQSSWSVDVEALRRAREEQQRERKRQESDTGEVARPRPLVLAALLGLPSCYVESSYQRFATAGSDKLPTWLVLMHLAACAVSVVQARCRRTVLPKVMLCAASFLLALCSCRLPRFACSRTYCSAAWALQALVLAAMVAGT